MGHVRKLTKVFQKRKFRITPKVNKSRFSLLLVRGAFNRLISSNLPLKYSVTGQLSPFDRVKNGFCDMGRLNKLEELKLPQDFTWEKRATPKQKIFLLNLGPAELDSQVVGNNVWKL